jgi:thiol-disulfide isomerase/thioredoxin
MLGQWLERNAHYDAAIEVFEEIKLAGEQGSVLERFQDRAVRVGKSGLLRCRLDGEKVSYIGVDFSGSELDQDKLNKKVVIVVFWSASSPDSVEYVKAINESGKTLGNKPIVVLAVCVDEDIPMDSPVLEGKSRAVRVVPAAYRGGFNSLLQRCPPVMLPHVMLIGFDGVVSDVNIEPMEVRDKALSLLLNRNR